MTFNYNIYNSNISRPSLKLLLNNTVLSLTCLVEFVFLDSSSLLKAYKTTAFSYLVFSFFLLTLNFFQIIKLFINNMHLLLVSVFSAINQLLWEIIESFNMLSSILSWNNYTHSGIVDALSNPKVDIDMSTNTDCEDLISFFNDIVEFAEQDKSLLLDAVFDIWGNTSWNMVVASLEIIFLNQLNKKPLSIFLAKFLNA